MHVIDMLAGETLTDATITGAAKSPTGSATKEFGVFQAQLSAAGTITLEGKVGEDLGWETINTYTSDTIEQVALFPRMRVTVAGNTGTVNAKLGY